MNFLNWNIIQIDDCVLAMDWLTGGEQLKTFIRRRRRIHLIIDRSGLPLRSFLLFVGVLIVSLLGSLYSLIVGFHRETLLA